MTCIVGLAHQGRVYIGGDSAGVSGMDLEVRADKKVFLNGGYLFGFTSSFRMGQLLRHAFEPPKPALNEELHMFMATKFIDALRSCLKAGGYAEKTNEREAAGRFLVGHAGRLFMICEDYQVAEPLAGYTACGCGDQVARGAMFVTEQLSPECRIRGALIAAEFHSAGVRGPFHILSV